jgi:hypothetical protein
MEENMIWHPVVIQGSKQSFLTLQYDSPSNHGLVKSLCTREWNFQSCRTSGSVGCQNDHPKYGTLSVDQMPVPRHVNITTSGTTTSFSHICLFMQPCLLYNTQPSFQSYRVRDNRYLLRQSTIKAFEIGRYESHCHLLYPVA